MASETYDAGANAPGHDDVFQADAAQSTPAPSTAQQTAPAAPPAVAPAATDDPFVAEEQPKSDTPPEQSMGDFLHQQLGEMKDAGVGFAHSAGQTVATAGHLLSHLGPMDDVGKQRLQWLDDHTQNTTAPQKLGGGIESVMEFIGGDEALKGLSVAERFAKLGSIAKILEAHPTLAKIADLGATSLRQGAVGAGQAGAHGASAGEMAQRGAEVAGGSAAIGAAVPALVGGANKVSDLIDNIQYSRANKSLAGVLARGSGLGDNFEPKATADATGPILRQVFKANPDLVAEATDPKATPEQTYKAFQKGVQIAQNNIDEAHQQALGPVRNYPVSVKPVLQAVEDSKAAGLEKYGEGDAAAIDDLKRRIGNIDSLSDLNGFRSYLTTELSPQFKQDGVAAGRSGAVDKAMKAALDEARATYYDGLKRATGQDFQPLKKLESHVLDARESLGNAKSGLFKKQSLAEEPTTGKQKIASGISLIGKVLTGDKKGLAEVALGDTPMAQTQTSMQRFMKNTPDSVPDSFEGQDPFKNDHPQLSDKSTPETIPSESTPNPGPRGASPEIGSGDALSTDRVSPTPSSQVQGSPEIQSPAAVRGGIGSGDALVSTRMNSSGANTGTPPPDRPGMTPLSTTPYPQMDPRYARSTFTTFNKPQPVSSGTVDVGPDGTAIRRSPQLTKGGAAAKAKKILGGKSGKSGKKKGS